MFCLISSTSLSTNKWKTVIGKWWCFGHSWFMVDFFSFLVGKGSKWWWWLVRKCPSFMHKEHTLHLIRITMFMCSYCLCLCCVQRCMWVCTCRRVDGYSDSCGGAELVCSKCTKPSSEIKENLSRLYSITLARISEVAGKHCTPGPFPRELCCSFLRDVLHGILPGSIWHFSRTEWMDGFFYLFASSHTTQMRSNN